jgi:hypothetical protein
MPDCIKVVAERCLILSFMFIFWIIPCNILRGQGLFNFPNDPAGDAEALFTRIKPLLIRSQVTSKDADTAGSVEFVVDRNDLGIKIAARKPNGVRQVVFSLGAVLAIRKINESFADIFCCQNGTPTRASIHSKALAWGIYMSTAGYHVNKRDEKAISELGRQFSQYPSYCQKTMAPARGVDCTRLEEEPDFRSRFDQAQFSSYAFIMGHELAHHIHGQVRGEPFFNKKGNEQEADRGGLAFVKTVDGQIVEALNALMLLSSIEVFGDPDDEIHPRPVCRIVQALNSPEAASIVDPGFVRYPASADEARLYEAFAIKERLLLDAAEDLRERADPNVITGIGDRERLRMADEECLHR